MSKKPNSNFYMTNSHNIPNPKTGDNKKNQKNVLLKKTGNKMDAKETNKEPSVNGTTPNKMVGIGEKKKSTGAIKKEFKSQIPSVVRKKKDASAENGVKNTGAIRKIPPLIPIKKKKHPYQVESIKEGSSTKRRKKEKLKAPKKFRKDSTVSTESDSENEKYIEKFFSELETSDIHIGAETPDDTDFSSSEINSDDYFCIGENEKKKKRTGNRWLEEENNLKIVYEDSEDEKDAKGKKPGSQLCRLASNDPALSDDDSEDAEGEDSEDNSDYSDDSESLDSQEYEYGSFSDEEFDKKFAGFDKKFKNFKGFDKKFKNMDKNFKILDKIFGEEDEDDSDSEDESASENESDSGDDSDSYDYNSYLEESYDSEDDEDFDPSLLNEEMDIEDNDALFIGRGLAKIYEIDDNCVSFSSDMETQIIELPADKQGPTSAESQSEADDFPKLIPFDYTSVEKILKRMKATAVKPNPEVEEKEKEEIKLEPMNVQELTESPEEEEEEIVIAECDKTNFTFYDSFDARLSLLILKNTLYMNGNLIVQLLVGNLEVLGYKFRKNETKTIYAARGYQFLNLSPAPDKNFADSNLKTIITKLKPHFRAVDLKKIEEDFDANTSTLLLLQSDLSNRRVSLVQRLLPESILFPRIETLRHSEFFRTEQLLSTQFYPEHAQNVPLFHKNESFDTIAMKRKSKIVAIGGKGTGKTTFCQYIINKNISKYKKILYIELDIGQPMKYIPETISASVIESPILGVGCFEDSNPIKSYLFGNLDIVSSPIKYIQIVKNLLDYCSKQKELQEIPWIVNTMGYVTGFAEELVTAILKFLQPTDLVQIKADNHNFKNDFTDDFVNKYSFNILREEVQSHMKRVCSFKAHILNAPFQYSKGRFLCAPAVRRNVAILAHLADILGDEHLWFSDIKPFVAPMDKLKVFITKEDDKPPEDLIPMILRASLVFLCEHVANQPLQCFGIGIVRAVDEKKNVYLLSALSTETLQKVNCLAVCCSTLPNSILLRQNPKLEGTIPYLVNYNDE